MQVLLGWFKKCVISELWSLNIFPKRPIIDSSKLKDVAGNNFNFGENDREFFMGEENTVGKGETAQYEQFLLFPQCFQKTCTADT